jgi:hypothetical protein
VVVEEEEDILGAAATDQCQPDGVAQEAALVAAVALAVLVAVVLAVVVPAVAGDSTKNKTLYLRCRVRT